MNITTTTKIINENRLILWSGIHIRPVVVQCSLWHNRERAGFGYILRRARLVSHAEPTTVCCVGCSSVTFSTHDSSVNLNKI